MNQITNESTVYGNNHPLGLIKLCIYWLTISFLQLIVKVVCQTMYLQYILVFLKIIKNKATNMMAYHTVPSIINKQTFASIILHHTSMDSEITKKDKKNFMTEISLNCI